jgi:hypothetical protein
MATIKKKGAATQSSGDQLTALGIVPPQFGMQLTPPAAATQQLTIAQAEVSSMPILNSANNTAGSVVQNKREAEYGEAEKSPMTSGSIAEKMKNAIAKNAPGQTKKQIFK